MPNSYRPEVQVAGEGSTWHPNGLRFATEKEAADNARDLSYRWLLVTAHRAAPSDDAPNYSYHGGNLVPLDQPKPADEVHDTTSSH